MAIGKNKIQHLPSAIRGRLKPILLRPELKIRATLCLTMSGSFLQVFIVLSVIFGGLLIIPLFTPAGRRERGFIYGAELALVLFAWFKMRNAQAILLGDIIWAPREVDSLRILLLIVAGLTALFLLWQFIPAKSSAGTPDEDRSAKSDSATSAR